MMKNRKNKINKNFEISPEIAAMLGRPSTPAIKAMIRKMNAHFNIAIS